MSDEWRFTTQRLPCIPLKMKIYLKGVNFRGSKFSRISRFFAKFAKCFTSLFVHRENFIPRIFSNLAIRENFIPRIFFKTLIFKDICKIYGKFGIILMFLAFLVLSSIKTRYILLFLLLLQGMKFLLCCGPRKFHPAKSSFLLSFIREIREIFLPRKFTHAKIYAFKVFNL